LARLRVLAFAADAGILFLMNPGPPQILQWMATRVQRSEMPVSVSSRDEGSVHCILGINLPFFVRLATGDIYKRHYVPAWHHAVMLG
jgi:hypothetical protein